MTAGALYCVQDGVILKIYKYLGIFYPALFCTIMVVTSAIIVFHLRISASNSRPDTGTHSASTTSTNMTSRDVRVSKMVLIVILVYLMDFFPRLCTYVASLIELEFFAYNRFHNLMQIASNTIWNLDFLNASVNFFIFMSMSTNFQTFYEIFPSNKA